MEWVYVHWTQEMQHYCIHRQHSETFNQSYSKSLMTKGHYAVGDGNRELCNSVLQFLTSTNCVCVGDGVLTVHCSVRPPPCPACLPRCSVLASPLSDRYRLAVTAFAARRLDVSYRQGCPAKISKKLYFYLGHICEKNWARPRTRTTTVYILC